MGACNTCDLENAQEGSDIHKSRNTATPQTRTHGPVGETSQSSKQAKKTSKLHRVPVNEISELSETDDTSGTNDSKTGNEEEEEEAPNTHDSDVNGGEQTPLVLENASHSADTTDTKSNENEMNKKEQLVRKDPFEEAYEQLVKESIPMPLPKLQQKEFIYDPNSEGAKWWRDWWVKYRSDKAQVLKNDKEYILKSFNSFVETHKIRDEEWNGNVIMVYSSKFQGIVYICWTHAQYVEYLLMA